jgi:hypothetical protein
MREKVTNVACRELILLPKSAVFLMFFSCDGYSGQQLPQKGTMLPLAQSF